MGGKEGGKTFLGEWVDRVERLRRWARAEVDELARLLEAHEGVRETVRRAAEPSRLAVGGELPLRREHEMDDRRRDRSQDEEQRPLEPTADPAHLDERSCEHDGRRLDGHVAPADMRE